jgi:hypothetical protein
LSEWFWRPERRKTQSERARKGPHRAMLMAVRAEAVKKRPRCSDFAFYINWLSRLKHFGRLAR